VKLSARPSQADHAWAQTDHVGRWLFRTSLEHPSKARTCGRSAVECSVSRASRHEVHQCPLVSLVCRSQLVLQNDLGIPYMHLTEHASLNRIKTVREPVHQTGTERRTQRSISETGEVSQLDSQLSPPRSSSPARRARSPCPCPSLPCVFMAWSTEMDPIPRVSVRCALSRVRATGGVA